MKDRIFTMQDMDRLRVLKRLEHKDINQIEAAKELKISTRHMRRLVQRVALDGDVGIRKRHKGGNRGHTLIFKRQVMDVVQKIYQDFGPTLASEKLFERDGLKVNKETLRQWMIDARLHKGRKRTTLQIHQSRKRRSRFGELIQLDGSHHDWFEGRSPFCCLLVLIDDATSQIVSMKFEKTETTQGYFRCLKDYLRKFGRPFAFYSDRHSIFKTTRSSCVDGKMQDTQMQRALRSLNIDLICANSPQAKGRVERANKTLQDRLIKELRLHSIDTIEDANAYLSEFIQLYNKKFSVSALSDEDVHRPLGIDQEKLDETLSLHQVRKLSKNLEFSYNKAIYQIQKPGGGYRYRGKEVTISINTEGHIKVLFGQERLVFKVLHHISRTTRIADRKTLDTFLDAKLTQKRRSLGPYSPQGPQAPSSARCI